MAAQKGNVSWFAIWVSVGVVVVLGVAAFFVIQLNNQATEPGPAPRSAVIDETTGAIAVGDAEDTLDTYIDFMCPICNQFEQLFGPEIEAMVEDGTITHNIHPIAILDRFSQGTNYSTRAANAMYCVAEADGTAAVPFMQEMFANQPAEGSTGLTDEQILAIAEEVGVTGIDECVTGGTYNQFVADMTQKTPVQPGASGIATPTVAVNGEAISNAELPADPTELRTFFQ